MKRVVSQWRNLLLMSIHKIVAKHDNLSIKNNQSYKFTYCCQSRCRRDILSSSLWCTKEWLWHVNHFLISFPKWQFRIICWNYKSKALSHRHLTLLRDSKHRAKPSCRKSPRKNDVFIWVTISRVLKYN